MRYVAILSLILACASVFAEAEKPPAPPADWNREKPPKPSIPVAPVKIEAPAKATALADEPEQHTEDADNKMIVFDVRKDEFSSKQQRRLFIGSKSEQATALVVTEIDGKIEIGLATKDVLFPDEIKPRNSGMLISITFKFDTQKEADQSSWSMNIMKYNGAWYEGDARAFIAALFSSGKLSLKTDTRGDVYRFDLTGIAKYKDKF